MDIIKRSVIVTIIITVILNCANCFAMAAFTENKKMYVISEKIPQNDYIIEGYNWSECISMYMDTSKISIEVIYIEDLVDDKDYNEFINEINRDDIVLIQTGNLYRDPQKKDIENIDKQEENEDRYVKDIKNKGAVPIIVLPDYAINDESTYLYEYFDKYCEMCKDVAGRNEIYYIEGANKQELDALSYEGLKKADEENYKILYAIIRNGENKEVSKYIPNFAFAAYHGIFIAVNLAKIDEFKDIVVDEINYNKVTRGEFVKQLLLIAGEDEEKSEEYIFNDVSSENKYYGYIARAKSMGIVLGDNNNCFKPNENIDLGDACVIADRLLQKRGIYLPDDDKFYKETAEALFTIKEYAGNSVTRFFTTVSLGMYLEPYYIWSIYGIYYIVYDELN